MQRLDRVPSADSFGIRPNRNIFLRGCEQVYQGRSSVGGGKATTYRAALCRKDIPYTLEEKFLDGPGFRFSTLGIDQAGFG
jgi:hypothetical protein